MACRKDGKGRVLRKGEHYRKTDGRYSYIYTDPLGKQHTIYAQVIDDISGTTLASASSLKIEDKLPKKEIAAKVGEMIAQNAKEAGIETVAFDRNGYLYHGRIKELADAARKGGLKF